MSTTSKLAGRQEIAEGTMAFRFEKPYDWTFKAGQAIDITLLAPQETDAEGNTRTFPIASAYDRLYVRGINHVAVRYTLLRYCIFRRCACTA